jgi:hypothetical protein
LDQREFEYKEDGRNGTVRNFSVPFTTYGGEGSLVSYIKTANKSNDSQAGLYAAISHRLLDLPHVTLEWTGSIPPFVLQRFRFEISVRKWDIPNFSVFLLGTTR